MSSAQTCSLDGCERPKRQRGWCRMHYARWSKYGDPGPAERINAINVNTTCLGPDCSRPATRKGYCGTHYSMAKRGDELRAINIAFTATRNMSLPERIEFYSAPANESGCRLWTGALNQRGYGVVNGESGKWGNLAHRVSYMLHSGDELEPFVPVHHVCGVTACVEPLHLKPVESWENSAEMLERTFYKRRIASLEEALRALEPAHELIANTKEEN